MQNGLKNNMNFKTDFKNPALFFSGGVESTLLYYIYATTTELPLTLYLIDRNNNPIKKALTVFSKVNKIIDFNHELKIESIPVGLTPVEQIAHLYEKVKYKHDIILYGVNKYPDDTTIRPRTIMNYNTVRNDKYVYAPFLDIDKSEIIKLYYDFKIDYLLTDTQSCGEDMKDPCKNCFNCREREWAFNRLGKEVIWGI
tara:strand:+ start:1570 stop:2163 length:594 start_codon:yes stop_codon:yes gene_type:complete